MARARRWAHLLWHHYWMHYIHGTQCVCRRDCQICTERGMMRYWHSRADGSYRSTCDIQAAADLEALRAVWLTELRNDGTNMGFDMWLHVRSLYPEAEELIPNE